MKIQNKPKHQSPKLKIVPNKKQEFNALAVLLAFALGALESSRVASCLMQNGQEINIILFMLGIILNQTRSPWTVLGRQKIFHFGHRFEPISKLLDRFEAIEGSQGSRQACKDPTGRSHLDQDHFQTPPDLPTGHTTPKLTRKSI